MNAITLADASFTVSNLHDNGHSTGLVPTAASADLRPLVKIVSTGNFSAITAADDALNEWLVFARLPTVTWPSQRTTALTKGERRQRAQSGNLGFRIGKGRLPSLCGNTPPSYPGYDEQLQCDVPPSSNNLSSFFL